MRLNEISDSRGNICLVTGSLRRIFLIFGDEILTTRFCGWWVRMIKTKIKINIINNCKKKITTFQ